MYLHIRLNQNRDFSCVRVSAMIYPACLRRCFCRQLLTLLLFSYLVMILVIIINIDLTEPKSGSEESFSSIFPDPTYHSKPQRSLNKGNNSNRPGNIATKRAHVRDLVHEIHGLKADVMGPRVQNIEVQYTNPVPLSEPMIDVEIGDGNAGDFVPIGRQAFVYSAYIDDRKEQPFIRVMTLMSQKAATLFIYCHFDESLHSEPLKSEHYQLCENHNNKFGGYIYSCQIPDIFDVRNMTSIVLSLTKFGPKTTLPLNSVRPPENRLAYLDSYPQHFSYFSFNKNVHTKSNVPSDKSKNTNGSFVKSPHIPFSFAICVSPLFGKISVHRLIEFTELSIILGANHIFFYNYSMPSDIADALKYYVTRGVATVLPWTFPTEVGLKVWYHGQLLANNDCLYRSMSRFDLVSFNDLDEFIVPHTNSSSTWKEVFPALLKDGRCGFSFQSAFYDPGTRDFSEHKLLTPVLTAKSRLFSKIRTKVMVCPWRVFEVGIHHISKQNREEWRPMNIDPSLAYLHHYRRCIANYGMRCSQWDKDTIIADRYLNDLTVRYSKALTEIMTKDNYAKKAPQLFEGHIIV